MKKKKFVWTQLPYSYHKINFNNPYCGFYSLYRFFAHHNIRDDDAELDRMRNSKNTLCLVEINLLYFNDKDLTDQGTENINKIVEYFVAQGKQVILRFLYDWEGKGILSEPKDFSYIIQHIRKISPLLKLYENDIYILQGLFIGSWGEMHGSRYLTDYHLTTLAKEIYNGSGDLTQIALRSPSFIRSIFRTSKPLSQDESYSNLPKSKFSLYNDGIMGSETDLGTYGTIMERDNESYSDKWIKDDELKYQYNLCRYVSNGGEVVRGREIIEAKTTIETLKKMRISYLNEGHDLEVLEQWKKTILDGSFKEHRGISLYEYIEAHLGYRYDLSNVHVKKNPANREELIVALKIANKGFSPSYNKFKVSILIRDENLNEIIDQEIETDSRYWLPESPIEIRANITTKNLEYNVYSMAVRIYDQRSRRFIEFSNPFGKMDSKGCYNIGSLKVKGS